MLLKGCPPLHLQFLFLLWVTSTEVLVKETIKFSFCKHLQKPTKGCREAFNLPPDSPTPCCESSVKQPLWGWKHSSLVPRKPQQQQRSLAQMSYFIWICWPVSPLCEAWHRRSVSALPSGAQWKALMHRGASVEEVMPYQSSALNRKCSLFVEDSTLFRYFVFTGQCA